MGTVPDEAARLVTSEPLMAHLATCRGGRPHVAPVWYVYDESDAVVELVTTGRKLANVRENPRVALSIQKDVEGRAQWMVSMLGTATVVDDDDATRDATRRINEKYGASESAWSENVLVRVAIGSASFRTY
ncbi:pyridoxamine 5'-phosphate oxidase family protein [Haloferax larsenii]|uniref:Pyridoxamine 5'-phosphate oxidase family protein n=1 Tax=Haloferax larsenii TaxID=302484 RepID=A0ABY5RBX5_HALLR|nr:pyridoxamine 5'-phosphate oxidase family protein [Haloferax larsenii]ELZ81440.1 flavin-nucleotide-binding protein [Haloferax larsenii JCM 13917]UVE49859.1 pyridoxamine 5'-phosphate oxidase family protein [Haloferax larsenii]